MPTVIHCSELRLFNRAAANRAAACAPGRLTVGRFGSFEGFEAGLKSRFMMVVSLWRLLLYRRQAAIYHVFNKVAI
jgi:hypothetical protein